MLIHRLLESTATRRPDAPAIIHGARTVSYAHLSRLIDRFASFLVERGVRRHDRVVIALENSIELTAAYLGTMKAGAVAVLLPAGPRSDRLSAAVVDCTPAVAVVDPATAREIDPTHALCAVPTLVVFGHLPPQQALPPGAVRLEAVLAAGGDAAARVRVIDSDLAAIIYTSGSTGEPRGVMLTHRNLVANTHSIVSYLGLTDRDRIMCVLPFYYVYGLSILHTHLAVGGTVVIENNFVYPNVVLRGMREMAVTGFAGVPSTFALLLNRSDLASTPLPALRYVTQAGGPMPAARIREWLDRGPKVPFFVMYGATEASARLTYLDPSHLEAKIGSIGKAIPNVEILVVRDNGSIAAPGEVGELVARGTNIALGYWNKADETAEKFGSLGYHTGDLGFADEDGYLFLVGRKHDMLKVGAHRVGAKEIEDVLNEFPNVLEAAVVAAPHDLLGEVPVAFISLRDPSGPGCTALASFCRERLAPHKVPSRFVLRADLPKLGSVGKIDRRALRDALPAETPSSG